MTIGLVVNLFKTDALTTSIRNREDKSLDFSKDSLDQKVEEIFAKNPSRYFASSKKKQSALS